MKLSRIIPVVILSTLVATTFASPLARFLEPMDSEQEFHWRTDLKSAHSESVAKNRPILIFIGDGSCGYCTRMEESTLADPETIEFINDEFVPLRLNVDDHERVVEVLEVERIPCTIALTPQADLLARITGYVNTRQYLDALKKVSELHEEVERTFKSSDR